MTLQTAGTSVKTWWRRSLAILVAAVLFFPVAASAVSYFSANDSETPSGSTVGSQDSPFTFDAPATNVAKATVESREIARLVATADPANPGVVVLDAWKYTGVNRGPGGGSSKK